MPNEKMTIAIDGYSSCGKSTLAKALAGKLSFLYIDTGAMYRAVTYYFLEHNVPLDNPEAITAALNDIHLDLRHEEGGLSVWLNHQDISLKIREMRISEKVSAISAIRQVRAELVRQQQALAARQNVIMDGRDIGTVVFPNAELKIFMTADPKIRAERRYNELLALNLPADLDLVYENLKSRDEQDTTREESPLRKAPDAILLDNTFMTETQQLDFVIKEVFKRKPSLQQICPNRPIL